MALTIVDFEGHWLIRREIGDRLAGRRGAFLGSAILRRQDGGLWVWSETGVMTLGEGPPMSAGRRYRWREEDGRIAVLFEDGRPFHDFLPEGAAESAHWCAPDDYRVRYDFSAWPVWRSRWVVRGPRKDYAMESLYTRPEV